MPSFHPHYQTIPPAPVREAAMNAEAAPSPAEMLALLRWYAEAGVDDPIGEEAGAMMDPARRRVRAPVPAVAPVAGPVAATPAPEPARAAPAAAPPAIRGTDVATVEARRVAAGAATLAELEAALRAFDGCALKLTATQLVFADGNPDAEVMIIGEAPGADEDRLGKPFVGQSGKLLDRMLATIGLDRTSVYITNIVTWRPPGNRQPNSSEVAICMPFVERHIALKRPKLLLAAGGTAAAAMLGNKEGITRIHGRWFDRRIEGLDAPIPLMPIYHPAFLLRTASTKRDVWHDLLTFKRRMVEMGLRAS
jgi:uracil-DNA glycosylase family 4